MAEVLTTGQISQRIGQPRARIEYAIQKMGIQERARAGLVRLFSVDQLPVIETAVKGIRSRKAGAG